MKRFSTVLAALALALACAAPARAHFLELIPSADVLPEGGEVALDIVFTHPAEGGPVMDMERPRRAGVILGGRTIDLAPSLVERPVDGKRAWQLRHALPEPGAAVFFVEPAPYLEPAEGRHIIHYTKVVVDSWASGEGWDALAGLPMEIRLLTRPTGLWTGNLMRGQVLREGVPLPFASVEVSFVNDGTVALPNDAFGTQVLLAGPDGTFAYAMPRAGWWGFAALAEADGTLPAPDGRALPVEIGGVVWVRTTDMTDGEGR